MSRGENASATVITSPSLRHIPALDGIRGLAVFLVLVAHLVGLSLDPLKQAFLRTRVESASMGVDLFFVLSGFLIGGILLDNRDRPGALLTFYVRRFFRIVPLYAVLLVVAFGFVLKLPEYAAPWWAYATFNGNVFNFVAPGDHWLPLAVTWSLSVEEQFYLLAPCVIFLSGWRRLPLVLVGVIAGAWLLRVALLTFDPVYGANIAHFSFPTRADGLACGILLAWAVRTTASEPVLAWISAHWGNLLALVVTLLVLDSLTKGPLGGWQMSLVGYPLAVAASALLIVGAIRVKPRWLIAALESPFLRSMGQHAYFLYLWHMMVWAIYTRFVTTQEDYLMTSWWKAIHPLAVGTSTWILAVFSWRCFESPLVTVGRRFAY